ncbi:MAG: PAS domain S-box protein, partial [Candidatus Electryonea clarkiae]|nr:PAS domain S-box protein [Candidatus Electryonea clarkiae]
MDFKSKTKSQLIAEIEILQNKINSFESSSTIDQIQENETEGKYRSFFENAFDGLIHLDLKGNILDVNKAAVNFFGGKKEELIGKHFTKTGVVSKKDIPLLLKTFANTITGKKASISLEITNKSEEKIFLECNTSFIRKNKKIAGVMGIARDITEYKKSEIELQESEQRFRMLMEKSPVCIEIFDKDGVLLDVNEAWENTWGVNGEEIIGKYNPLDNEQFKMMGLLPLIEQAFAGESVQLPDVEFDPAASGLPGRKLWIRGYAYHLEDKDSNVKNVIMLSENITEQKLAEEEIRKSEEKYRSIFESFQDLYYRTDSQGIVTLVSPSVRQLGYEPEELIGRPAADFFANPSDRSKFMEEISLSGSVQDYEVKIQNKEDENLYASLTASLIEEEDGNLVGIEGVIRDITKRKKSEKQLRESEEKFRLINEQSLVGIVIIQENEIKHINEAVFQISETEKSEFEKSALKGIMKQVHPDDVQMVQDQLQKKQKGEQQGTVPNYVFRLIPNSGQTKWLEIYSKTIVYNDDPADLIMLLDITERKEAANQIKQLQEYLQLQVERMPVGLIVWDTDFRVESWNSAAENIFGYTAEEILGKHPYDFIVPEDIQPKLDAIWDRLFDGDMTAYSENDNVTKDGRRITCNWSNTPLREDDGTIIGVLSMVEDITQQKIAMSDLQESEEKYRILFETMEQGVVYQDVNGEITSANPAAERLLGLTIEQMQGRTSIDPRWKAIKEDGSDFQGEKHPSMIALKDGRSVRDTVMGVFIPTTDSYRWIIVNAVPQFKTGEDRTYQVFTTFSDITEIKKTEERMRFMKFSIDHSADSAFWMGPDAQFIYVNEAVCESLGYTPEEMLTMTVHDIDPDFPQDVWLDHWKDMKQLKSFSMESHHRKKDGQVFPVEVTVNYVEFEGQEYNCAFSKDITERKIAEQALSESERQYRTIFESLQDLFYRTDHEGNILLVSPSVRQFGYEPEDLIGCSSTDFYSDPSDGDKFMKIIMEEGSITSYEIQLTKKDGTVVDASITASLLKNDDGSFAGIEGVLRDISENKKAEEELKASEERYHGLADASFEAVFISEKGICLDANRAACEMFGYECDELIGIFGTDVIAPESKELVKSNMTSGFEEPYEALAQRKDGSTFYCEIHGKMTEHKGRDVRITVLRDVDEKRRAEVALRESEEQYRAIFESFQDIYYRTDKKGKLTLISPSVRKYGYEPEDLLGHYVSDYYTNPRERRYLMKKIAQDGFVEDYEVQLVANDGTIIDSSLNAHLFADEAGNAVGVEGILRVITERKHAENLTRIQKELAIKLGETTSIEKALADCIDAAIQISIMDSGGIYLVDPETGDIDLSYSEGFKPEYVKMVSHYKSDSNNAIIVNAGKPIHVTHAELNIDLSDIERSEGLKCISVIPILHEGRAVGCMNMGSHSKGDISEFEKE